MSFISFQNRKSPLSQFSSAAEPSGRSVAGSAELSPLQSRLQFFKREKTFFPPPSAKESSLSSLLAGDDGDGDRRVALPRVLQICLLQISTAIAFVLINSILNRVMIVELKIDAWLVGMVIGVHNLLAFVRPIIGHYSDTHLFFGYRRTPNILAGNLITVSGLILFVYGAVMLPQNFTTGIAVCFTASLLYGLGVNMTGTLYFSLLADSAGEKHKAKAASIGWFVMMVGLIASSGFISKYLEVFSEAKLIQLFWIGAAVSVGTTWLALLGTEKRFAEVAVQTKKPEEQLPLRTAMKHLVANTTVYRFFMFMFVTVIAIQGQDVILEPFGAHIFGLSVAQTAQLTQTWGVGTMIGIVALGLFAVNRLGKKRTIYIGCLASAAAFIVICVSPMFNTDVFKVGVFMLGLGNGALTVGTLTLMMDMTTEKNTGLFMGLWGMAQAMANFLANTIGGGIRDISLALTGNQYYGYTAAFSIEVIGLLAAMVILRTIEVQEFKRKTAEDLTAVTAD